MAKKIVDVSIQIGHAAVNDSLVTFSIGGQIPIGKEGKDFDTVVKIEVSEWLKRVRIHYSSGSIVTYKGFRFIYGEKLGK